MATVLSALQAYIASAYAADSGVASSGEVPKLSHQRLGSFGRPGTLVLEGDAVSAASLAAGGLSHSKPDRRR